jgi:hypothetical protein
MIKKSPRLVGVLRNQKQRSMYFECDTDSGVAFTPNTESQRSFVRLGLGYGYERRISSSLKIYIEPQFGFTITNYFDTNLDSYLITLPEKSRFASFGLATGLLFK